MLKKYRRSGKETEATASKIRAESLALLNGHVPIHILLVSFEQFVETMSENDWLF